MKVYRTSDMARAGGVHVNTVRLYEDLGYLPPVPRNPANNYRQFSERHLDHMRLIRLALRISWLGGQIGHIAVEVITLAASDDLPGAMDRARDLAARVESEHDQAEAAAETLDQWAHEISPQRRREHRENQGKIERKTKENAPLNTRRGVWQYAPKPHTYKTHHSEGGVLSIGQTAELLDVSIDMLRNWERNGLISDIPRDPRNNYRLYGTAIAY